tara:strand:- start:43 stop:1503 length:1461 start_codon:yes stop_codon:yes gene_type:complete
MGIIMAEEPRCPICLGEFNDTDCPPYIACQKGGHAFCKDCIRDMIPDSRNMNVTNIHGQKYAIYINFLVNAPMAESQIQFNCPICREKISLFDNEPIRSYPFFPVFTCQRIPLRYLKEHADTPSRSIEEREKAREKIAREITDKTIEFQKMVAGFSAMAAGFSETVIDFRETEETERNKLAEIKEEYDATVQKTIALEKNEAKLLNSIAALTRMYNEKEKEINEKIAQMHLEHEKNLSEINEKEKEMRETIEKNKDTLMGKMYRQAREEVQKEMEDDREKMMNEMLADSREHEEQFKIAMEARKADTELAYQIRRKNLERDIKLVERSLAKLNAQYEEMKKDAKGMTKHYYDEEMAKIKSMVANARQKIEHELEQFSATREEFGEYIKMKNKFMVRFREFSPQSYSYNWTTTQIKSDKEIMMWSILSELLDSEGSDSMKSIEDYMEFRMKNKNAKQNGRRWTNYSVDRWLKNYVKTNGGSTAGWCK